MVESIFASYVPQDRRYALGRGADLPDRTSGAALFADISGFTTLAETLSQQLGPQRGAEELTHQLNQVFGSLIAEVDRYGGSVVSFSGDAIMCWFDDHSFEVSAWSAGFNRSNPYAARRTPHASGALRATAAALAMQQALRQPAVDETGGVLLAIKVAVAAGSARRFLVGDPSILRVDVLAGRAIDAVGAVARATRRGEVLVDCAAAEVLGGQVDIVEQRPIPATKECAVVVGRLGVRVAAAPWPGTQGVAAEARAWILHEVAARLSDNDATFLADLRPATALFLNFSGIDYDDPGASAALDAYVRHVQATLARYHSALIQMTIDDKGSYLYVAFGAPVAAADVVVRAVACAFELATVPLDLSYIREIRIGLAHGQMYSGAYGSPTRRTYGVLGDKTNLAARLMAAAEPGTILCDDAVARLAARRWTFAPLAPVRLKGKAGLVRVYVPVAEAGRQEAQSAGSPPALVGRAAEAALLAAALDDLQRGVGRALVIEGEAGIGKSRLVGELARLVRERGLVGLIGAGQSIERQTPYRAWRDIFASYFELDNISESEEARARVSLLVHDIAPDLEPRLPLLNDLLDLGLPETPLTASFDPARRQQSLAGLLVELLRVWARDRPLVLVFEDAHWLDSLSWMLVGQVARAFLTRSDAEPVEPIAVLLVIVTRPLEERDPAASPALALRVQLPIEAIRLGALSSDEVAALVSGRLGLRDGGLPASVAALVQRRAGGNPFFAEELIATLLERGLIAVVRGVGESPRCIVSDDLARAEFLLPDTLQGLVLERIDQLLADCRLTLKVAAVIGRSFAVRPLYATLERYNRPEADARTHLAELVQRDLVLSEAVEPEPTYAFKHIITQEVAYQTLLHAQRIQIHRAVAEWYETTYDLHADAAQVSEHAQPVLRQSEVVHLLVHHYHQAGDSARERVYARLAGEQAAAQLANVEAAAYFSRALELTPADQRAARYELIRAREQVCEILGDRVRQAADLDELGTLAEELADDRRRADVLLRRAHYGQVTGDFATAVAAARHAGELARAQGDVTAEASAYLQWGWALLRQARDYDLSRFQLRRSLALARAAGSSSVETVSLRVLSTLALDQGEYADAWEYSAQARRVAEASGDRLRANMARCMCGFIAREQGNYRAGHRHTIDSLHVAREIGDRKTEEIALVSLGMNYCALGDYDASLAAFAQSRRIAHEIGDRHIEGWTLQGVALVVFRRGEHAEARAIAEQALALHRDVGDQSEETRTLGLLGAVLLELGDRPGAAAAYTRCLDLLRALGQSYREIEPLAGLADVARLEGNLARATSMAEAVLAHLAAGRVDGPYDTFYAPLVCYRVLRATGDPRAAGVLHAAHERLLRCAAGLDDERLRHGFLRNLPTNRALIAAWEELGTDRQ